MASDHGYTDRMRNSTQFSYFGITPQWKPNEKDIDGFCHDEVVRQGHDPEVEDDGGKRVKWMRGAWSYAQRYAHRPFGTNDALTIAQHIEPQVNALGYRSSGVWIAGRAGMDASFLSRNMTLLIAKVADVQPKTGRTMPLPQTLDDERAAGIAFGEQVDRVQTADDWYLMFEFVHPFGDGNGRTGKVLHNWLLGTLFDPVLVYDYFGHGNP